MKKTVAAAVAAAFVVGTASTSFAASNPFSDVPAGHWAYAAVTSLANEGIITGYGDGTYQGKDPITRYEMAQMIAKALARTDDSFYAKYDEALKSKESPQSARNDAKGLKRYPHEAQGGGGISAKSMATLQSLVEEFKEELNALGVRVDRLEAHDDKVIWQGKIEYTYKSHRTDNYNDNGKTKVNQDDWIFRFEPIMVVNGEEDPNGAVTLDNGNKVRDENGNLVSTKTTRYKSLWTLRARIDAHADLSRNESSNFELVRGWAQGDYKNFQVKVGKQPLYTNEDGIVWDTEYSGAEVTFGNLAKGLKGTIYGGRLSAGTAGGGIRHAGAWDGRRSGSGEARFSEAAGTKGNWGNDPSSFWGVNLQYQPGAHGLFVGGGYYQIKDDDFNNYVDSNGVKYRTYSNSDTDKAKIWSANLGYKFSDKAQLWGSYAENTEADVENDSWQALFKYGNLYGGGNQGTKKGQWAVWAGYKKLGSNASLCAINWDDAFAGTKGVVAGFSVAPMDRVVFLAKYFKGKYITGSGDAERLFGRVEFFY